VPSWAWPAGLNHGSKWTGTRNYSAYLAVPCAINTLRAWRPPSSGTLGGAAAVAAENGSNSESAHPSGAPVRPFYAANFIDNAALVQDFVF